jgi:hypothetical protein
MVQLIQELEANGQPRSHGAAHKITRGTIDALLTFYLYTVITGESAVNVVICFNALAPHLKRFYVKEVRNLYRYKLASTAAGRTHLTPSGLRVVAAYLSHYNTAIDALNRDVFKIIAKKNTFQHVDKQGFKINF